jgi:hypothetical protein
MANVKISQLPAGIAAANAVVPATNADGTVTEKITLAGIAALATSASQLTSGTLPDSRLSANVVLTGDARLSDARTPTAHSHAIGDVTNLQTSLDAKVANAGSVSAIMRLTQAEYDAISSPDATTLYVIVG